MKCVILNHCVKLFGRSIHCLAKIGDELFFEALKDGLALRTVNSSRSAYACFLFTKEFFYEYTQGSEFIANSNRSEMLKCKLTIKSCLSIFKSLATIEKTVDKCIIEFKPDECRLIYMMYCKHGIIKTYNLAYQECESLQAVFSKELCPNLVTAQSKVLQDTVSNFPNSCEEITLCVSPQSVKVKNYIDGEPDLSKIVNTEMTLVPEEFDNFQVGIDTSITFCLKELRAILAFTDFVNQPLSMHFEQAGKPIILALDNDHVYEAHLVMATLSENISTQQTDVIINKDTQMRNVSSYTALDESRNNNISQRLSTKEKFLIHKNKSIKPVNNDKIAPNVNPSEKNTEIDPFFSASCPINELINPVHEGDIDEDMEESINTDSPCKRSHLNSSILRNSCLQAQPFNRNVDMIFSPPKVKKSKFFSEPLDEIVEVKKVSENEVLLCADTDDESD